MKNFVIPKKSSYLDEKKCNNQFVYFKVADPNRNHLQTFEQTRKACE